MTPLKHFYKHLFVVVILLGISFSGFSQVNPKAYLKIEQMKVEPENWRKYIDVEQEIWRKVHEKRMEAGLIEGWYLYSIAFPGGSLHDYNFATVTRINKFENLVGSYPTKVFTEALPGMSMVDIENRTYASRTLMNRNILALIDEISDIENPTEPSKYSVVNYMSVKPENIDRYIKLERETWKPIHEELIQTGIMHSWSLYSVYLPSGSKHKINFITIDEFKSFSDLENPYSHEVLKKVYKRKKLRAIEKELRRFREVVHTEVWELVDYVN